jgi:hypothetical protein
MHLSPAHLEALKCLGKAYSSFPQIAYFNNKVLATRDAIIVRCTGYVCLKRPFNVIRSIKNNYDAEHRIIKAFVKCN